MHCHHTPLQSKRSSKYILQNRGNYHYLIQLIHTNTTTTTLTMKEYLILRNHTKYIYFLFLIKSAPFSMHPLPLNNNPGQYQYVEIPIYDIIHVPLYYRF